MEKMKTVEELQTIQKEINDKALVILNSDFSGPVEEAPLMVPNVSKKKNNTDFKGLMDLIKATEHVQETSTIYQDIIDEAYTKEYRKAAAKEFADAIQQSNDKFVEKSLRINNSIDEEKAVVKM